MKSIQANPPTFSAASLDRVSVSKLHLLTAVVSSILSSVLGLGVFLIQ